MATKEKGDGTYFFSAGEKKANARGGEENTVGGSYLRGKEGSKNALSDHPTSSFKKGKGGKSNEYGSKRRGRRLLSCGKKDAATIKGKIVSAGGEKE